MVWCTAPTKNSEPSGLALAASEAPTVPPAPPLLSIDDLLAELVADLRRQRAGRRRRCRRRPGNGLSQMIGPLGQAWARTTPAGTGRRARPQGRASRARRREVLNREFHRFPPRNYFVTVLLFHFLEHRLKLGAQVADQHVAQPLARARGKGGQHVTMLGHRAVSIWPRLELERKRSACRRAFSALIGLRQASDCRRSH